VIRGVYIDKLYIEIDKDGMFIYSTIGYIVPIQTRTHKEKGGDGSKSLMTGCWL